jgi:HK97 family phage portal protein
LPFTDFLPGLFRKADPEPTQPAPVTLTDPLAAWLFGAQPTYSNISVTPKTAMQVPAVALAVQTVANAVGGLPVKLYVRNGKGKEADPAHPAFTLAHDEANPWTSSAELRAQLTRDALLHDNGGFALAVRGGSGNVVEFHRLDPLAVETKIDEASREPFYLVREGRKAVRHEYWDILHVRKGDGAPINLARNAIGLAIDLERHAAGLFANSARPSGFVRTTQKNDTALNNMKAVWERTFGGRNSGGTAFLPEGTEYQALTMTSTDAQFLETRRHQVEEIARAFNVPPTMLYDLERGTWSNTAQMDQHFLNNSLKPWLKAWCWAYARVLLKPEERKTRFFEFITNDLMTLNPAERTDIYGKMVAMRAMTPNEVRAGLNMPALPGGDELANPYTTTSATPQADNDNPPDNEKDAA